jgi:3-oxoadipate enol-lactonase
MTEVGLVQAGGIRLAYRESGPACAPPLLLLHALGENSADWDLVAAALAASWHVYALDLRDHGRSDWPGSYTLALLRDDVLAFLDALKLPEVTAFLADAGGTADPPGLAQADQPT